MTKTISVVLGDVKVRVVDSLYPNCSIFPVQCCVHSVCSKTPRITVHKVATFGVFREVFYAEKKSSARRTLLPRKSMQRGQSISGETVSEVFSLRLCMCPK